MYYNLPDKYFYPVVEKDDLEFEDNLFRSMDVEAGEEKEKREEIKKDVPYKGMERKNLWRLVEMAGLAML